MNKFLLNLRYAVLASIIFLSSCSDDDGDSGSFDGANYAILNAADKWEEGYITAYDEFPSGTLAPVEARSLQAATSFGFRSYKNWIFARGNAAGDPGLQKYTINSDGTIKSDGFIMNASQFLVVDENTGFYLDESRGTMKIQTFDPGTMTRTGEIDLSQLRNTEIAPEYQVVGKHTLAAKGGKLFAGMTYGTTAAEGFGDDVIDSVEFVVVDIATGTYEKTIHYNDDVVNSIGWGSSGNKMWSLGDDGALYFYSTGLTNGFQKTKVVRIKAGETEFDKEWSLEGEDIGEGHKTSIVTALVKDGKIYVEAPSKDIDLSTLQDIAFDYYVVDLASGNSTKITGMPQHHYAYANEQAITEIDGNVYFWVRNPEENIDGYYKLNADGTSATQIFNIDHDGFMWGFVKLEN